MLYSLLRFLFTFAVKGYFRRIHIRGLERIPGSGPLLLAANHTSAFMDPIVLGVYVPRRLYFLSRGSAFRKPLVARILGLMHMIPVYRPEFEPEDVGRNEDTFQWCYDHLDRRGAILIFPEGVSLTGRHLRHLKSGVARIALGAEARHEDPLGVTIVPVGINYSNPHQFQSDVFVNVGRPIEASEYRKAFSEDPRRAVADMMDTLRIELESRTIHIREERLRELVAGIETLYRADMRDETLEADKLRQDFYLSRDIADAVTWMDDQDPDRVDAFRDRLRTYLRRIGRVGLRDSRLKDQPSTGAVGKEILMLVLGFPLFAAGWLFNILPFKLAGYASTLIRVRADFVGSIRLAAGMFVFLFVYLAQAGLITWWLSWPVGVLVLFQFYPLGVLTLHWLKAVWRLRYSLDYLRIRQEHGSLIRQLETERQALIDQLEDGRRAFEQAGKPRPKADTGL